LSCLARAGRYII
jgi:hypothetical protein